MDGLNILRKSYSSLQRKRLEIQKQVKTELTVPFSSKPVSITITLTPCSQTICQKSFAVWGIGPEWDKIIHVMITITNIYT